MNFVIAQQFSLFILLHIFSFETMTRVSLSTRYLENLLLTRHWVRQSGSRHRWLCSIWCRTSTARGSACCRASSSSVTVQQLMSSLRRAVLSTAEQLRHRALCSGCCRPLYGAQSRGNEYCGEGDVIGRYAVMRPCAGSVFCWTFCRKLANSLARRLEGQSPIIGGCLYSPPVPRRRFWQSCTFPGLETISPK